MKPIPLYSFGKLSDDELLISSRQKETSTTGNPHFPEATPWVAKLKTANDEFEVALIEARDGGKLKTAVKDQKRKAVEKALKDLALYVQLNCNDDVTILLSSGFEAHSDGEPLAEPGAPKKFTVVLGQISGSVVTSVAAHKNAKVYVFEYALLPENGEEPDWKILIGKRKRTIIGLAPRKEYMFRSAIKGNSDDLIYSDIINKFVA